MTTREQLHWLIDQLSEEEIAEVLALLESRQHPPVIGNYDDPATVALIQERHAEALQDLREGKTIPLAQVMENHARWQGDQAG